MTIKIDLVLRMAYGQQNLEKLKFSLNFLRNQSPLPIYTEQKLSNKFFMYAATHNFIGASFQHVPRLKKIFSRQPLEISDVDAKKETLMMVIFVEFLTILVRLMHTH